MIRQRLVLAVLLNVTLSAACFAAVERRSRVGVTPADLANPEQQFASLAVHDANFAAMSHMTIRVSCEAAQPPEALATPDPLVDAPVTTPKITVSFIIGTDGRVHSPLILESLGPLGDRIVLDAVRAWRYRPATCNGVPTEVEGKIAFSSR
jgi:TonB family protein